VKPIRGREAAASFFITNSFGEDDIVI